MAKIMDSLPVFDSVEDMRKHFRRMPRPELAKLQKEVDTTYARATAKYQGMVPLFHGAPQGIIDKIRSGGFELTQGERSGFMGAIKKVNNLAVFLSEDKQLARAFGSNRDPYGGAGAGVVEVRANISKTLNMTKWGKQIPLELRRLALDLIEEEDGFRHKSAPQAAMFWLIDQKEFVGAVKSAGYDSVRFKESTATKKALGLERTAGDTIGVFDMGKLHVVPLPSDTIRSLKGLFNHLKKRKVAKAPQEDIDKARAALADPNGPDDLEDLVSKNPGLLEDISLFDVLDAAWTPDNITLMIIYLVDAHRADPNVNKAGTYLADEVWKRYGYKVGDKDTPMTDMIILDGIKAPQFAKTLADRLETAAERGKFIDYVRQKRGPSAGEWERLKTSESWRLYWNVIGGNWNDDTILKGLEWLLEREGVPPTSTIAEDYMQNAAPELSSSQLEFFMNNVEMTKWGNEYLVDMALDERTPNYFMEFIRDGRVKKEDVVYSVVNHRWWGDKDILKVTKRLVSKGFKTNFTDGDNLADSAGWEKGVKSSIYEYIVEDLGIKPNDEVLEREWVEYRGEVKELSDLKMKPEKIPFGRMTIVNGGVIEKDMRKIMGGLKKISARLKSKGFGHLLYGPIVVVPQEMPSQVWDVRIRKYKDMTAAAFYYAGPDILVFNAEAFLRDVSYGMKTTAHELGHRQWFKFLSATQRKQWRGEYEERGEKITRKHAKDFLDVIYLLMKKGKDKKGYRYNNWEKFDSDKLARYVFNLGNLTPELKSVYEVLIEVVRKYDWMTGRMAKDIVSMRGLVEFLETGDESGLPRGLKSERFSGMDSMSRAIKERYKEQKKDFENTDKVFEKSIMEMVGGFAELPSSTSEYGRNNDKEDYAEAFGYYMANKSMPAGIHDLFMSVHGLRKSSTTAALLNDYGITDAIMDMVGPTLGDIREKAENDDLVGIFETKGSFKGKVLGLGVRSMMTPEEQEVFKDIRFDISFERSRENIWSHGRYHPGKKLILFRLNTNLPDSIGELDWKNEKAKFLRDVGRFDLSLRHEVTHALRDAMTGHIETYAKNPENMKEYQSPRSHIEVEFEIDAIVNSFDRLRERMGPEKWDEMTPLKLKNMIPGLKLPDIGDSYLKVWVKRLMREGLLTEGMRKGWRLSSKYRSELSKLRGITKFLKKHVDRRYGVNSRTDVLVLGDTIVGSVEHAAAVVEVKVLWRSGQVSALFWGGGKRRRSMLVKKGKFPTVKTISKLLDSVESSDGEDKVWNWWGGRSMDMAASDRSLKSITRQ